MTKEYKELLLKDICARLPYGVKASTKIGGNIKISFVGYDTIIGEDGDSYDISFITPYLFPLSSMTEEQRNEFLSIQSEERKILFDALIKYRYGKEDKIPIIPTPKHIDWCYKNHLDIHGLIPEGLAIDATGLNIY